MHKHMYMYIKGVPSIPLYVKKDARMREHSPGNWIAFASRGEWEWERKTRRSCVRRDEETRGSRGTLPDSLARLSKQTRASRASVTRTTRRESTLDTGEEDLDGRFLDVPEISRRVSFLVPFRLSFLEDETPRDCPG